MHSMCSYMAMFPPSMPHVFLRWLTDEGDVVYDPFSGRGTVPFEACLMGRRGLGSDANPLAWVLTAAKVDPPSREEALARVDELQRDARDESLEGIPDQVQMLFSQSTLARLAWLQSQLDQEHRTDRYLLALLLGKLHLNADRAGRPRGLTVAMPNTFAMAPAYVSRYIGAHDLQPPEVDPVAFLHRQVERSVWPSKGFLRGAAWIQDSRDEIRWPRGIGRAKLIFTSPPYLSVIKYGKFNWVRLWLLGHDPKDVDGQLFGSESRPRYTAFLEESVRRLRTHLRDDGYLCLVIGDVRSGDTSLNLAAEVAGSLTTPDLKLLGTVVDKLPIDHKVSRIWGSNRGRATNTDRVLIFGAPSAAKPRGAPHINWEE